ncbi:eukaryotic rRNA processing, partial [Dimargaris cristalligena]
DPEDELKRELAFYSQALECAKLGRSRFQEAGAPFNRPDDYFAEMVKSDDQMLRIRKRLLEQTKTIAASEEARRQRDLKKYGGKIQAEKLLDRQKRKSEALDKIKALKRKRGDVSGHPGTEGADDMVDYDDQFDIALSDNEDGESRPAAKKGTKVRGGKASGSRKMPRSSRDAKYGFGGKRRHGKSNTRESLGDLEG